LAGLPPRGAGCAREGRVSQNAEWAYRVNQMSDLGLDDSLLVAPLAAVELGCAWTSVIALGGLSALYSYRSSRVTLPLTMRLLGARSKNDGPTADRTCPEPCVAGSEVQSWDCGLS
jgi:hypothetical protein